MSPRGGALGRLCPGYPGEPEPTSTQSLTVLSGTQNFPQRHEARQTHLLSWRHALLLRRVCRRNALWLCVPCCCHHVWWPRPGSVPLPEYKLTGCRLVCHLLHVPSLVFNKQWLPVAEYTSLRRSVSAVIQWHLPRSRTGQPDASLYPKLCKAERVGGESTGRSPGCRGLLFARSTVTACWLFQLDR